MILPLLNLHWFYHAFWYESPINLLNQFGRQNNIFHVHHVSTFFFILIVDPYFNLLQIQCFVFLSPFRLNPLISNSTSYLSPDLTNFSRLS